MYVRYPELSSESKIGDVILSAGYVLGVLSGVSRYSTIFWAVALVSLVGCG